MKTNLEHLLDLCAADGTLELFAEEVSSSEQMQLCCEYCMGTVATSGGCFACIGTAFCDCCS